MNQLFFETQNIEFIDQDLNEAQASVSLNPTFRWCKFILTDDKPNLNKKRIPEEEFSNLIQTGVHAPIKMAIGEIKNGHNDAIPLGVITALKKENNYVTGLAALWSQERPEDVESVKKAYDEGKPLNLSWEILYEDEVPEDDGVMALHNTALRATTLVGLPAYAGRTPILQVASIQQEDNSNVEDNTLEELEQLKARIAELEASLSEKNALLEQKETELSALKTENLSLAEFKSLVEEQKLSDEKLASIKSKFVEAGIEKDDVYFETNREKLLAMDEDAINFMLQELISFASLVKTSNSSVKVPNLSSGKDKLDPKELGRKLRTTK